MRGETDRETTKVQVQSQFKVDHPRGGETKKAEVAVSKMQGWKEGQAGAEMLSRGRGQVRPEGRRRKHSTRTAPEPEPEPGTDQ